MDFFIILVLFAIFSTIPASIPSQMMTPVSIHITISVLTGSARTIAITHETMTSILLPNLYIYISPNLIFSKYPTGFLLVSNGIRAVPGAGRYHAGLICG